MQLGVRNDKKAALVEAVGLKVAMDRGPKLGYLGHPGSQDSARSCNRTVNFKCQF